MEFRQIVAVTKLSGLYQLLSTKKDGAMVRSLADKSIKFVSARIHHITPLESIEIYTTDENVRLHEILQTIKKDDKVVLDLNSKKDDKATRSHFHTILPNFDEDRVYTSDIKKIFKWYEILKDNDLLNFDYLNNNIVKPEDEPVIAEETTVETPKPKKATKKAAEPADTEEKVEKKAAPKKKKVESEEKEVAAPKKTAKKKAE